MFFEQHFEPDASIESKLQRPDGTGPTDLLDVLFEETLLQEVSSNNEAVASYLAQADTLKKLLSTALVAPSPTASPESLEAEACSRAHDVLSAGNPVVLEAVAKNPRHLDYIFSMLSNTTTRTPPLTMLHILQILGSLVVKHPSEMLACMRRHPNYLNYLLHYLGVSGMDNLVLLILMQDAEFTRWWSTEAGLIPALVHILSAPTGSTGTLAVPFETQSNVMNMLCLALEVPASSESAPCVAPFVTAVASCEDPVNCFITQFTKKGLAQHTEGAYLDRAVWFLERFLGAVPTKKNAIAQVIGQSSGAFLKQMLTPNARATRAGLAKVQGYNLVALLVECGVSDVVSANELDVAAVQCLQKFTRNSLLHGAITRMFVAFLREAPAEKCRLVLQRSRLAQWVAKEDAANSTRRTVFGGHALELMTAILEVLPSTGITVESVQGLADYKAGLYQRQTALQMNPLLGIAPASCKTLKDVPSSTFDLDLEMETASFAAGMSSLGSGVNPHQQAATSRRSSSPTRTSGVIAQPLPSSPSTSSPPPPPQTSAGSSSAWATFGGGAAAVTTTTTTAEMAKTAGSTPPPPPPPPPRSGSGDFFDDLFAGGGGGGGAATPPTSTTTATATTPNARVADVRAGAHDGSEVLLLRRGRPQGNALPKEPAVVRRGLRAVRRAQPSALREQPCPQPRGLVPVHRGRALHPHRPRSEAAVNAAAAAVVAEPVPRVAGGSPEALPGVHPTHRGAARERRAGLERRAAGVLRGLRQLAHVGHVDDTADGNRHRQCLLDVGVAAGRRRHRVPAAGRPTAVLHGAGPVSAAASPVVAVAVPLAPTTTTRRCCRRRRCAAVPRQ
eukprot:PhM_4_TR18724/c4_g1_i2/m.73261